MPRDPNVVPIHVKQTKSKIDHVTEKHILTYMDSPQDPTKNNASKAYWKDKLHLAKVHEKEDRKEREV